MGEGRIRTLNNEVLPHFNELSVLVDKHGTAVALEVSLRATDDQRVHRRLKDAVYCTILDYSLHTVCYLDSCVTVPIIRCCRL